MSEEQASTGVLPAVPAQTPPTMSFDLPQSVLALLPSDPFEQLDVARRITSLALSTRLAQLEEETVRLRRTLADRDDLIADLRAKLGSVDSSVAFLSGQFARAEEDKETLMNENASLCNAVKKLIRDVSKVGVFRKTVLQSLQVENGSSHKGASKTGRKTPCLSSVSSIGALTIGTLQDLLLTSPTSTPRLTPHSSPMLATTSKSFKERPAMFSPMPTATSKSFKERPAMFSPMPTTNHTTMTSPFDNGTQAGQTQADGKEFFRQVRSRLSFQQFGAFLANVKELNSRKQTKAETLRKAEEIFDCNNKDLYIIFEGLINRNLHGDRKN